MIKLKSLLFEGMIPSDLERFREPLHAYMLKTFPKEYDPKQLLLFNLSLENLIDIFLNKILSIKITIEYDHHRNQNQFPYGTYYFEADEIEIGGINFYRNTSDKYIQYVDSVIYHELIHAINSHKKLFDKLTYDALVLGDKYYSDPEEIRAYTSQLKDFLIGHLGFSRKQAENMMNIFSSDNSGIRKKWISRYHDLKEIKYPLAGQKDLQSYEGMEGWKGKIIWISPDQFLKLVYPLPDNEKEDESSKNLEYRMKNGLPLDFLVLEVDMKKKKITGHEGRHRAIIAKKLGIQRVPVLIYTGSMFKRVPQWGPEDHSMINKLNFKPEYDKS